MRKFLHQVAHQLKGAAAVAAPPANESARLAALRRYDVLDTLPEAAFDDLTKLAANICDTPVVIITLVDEGRLWFKSRIGVPLAEVPHDSLPCNHAILGDDLLVVEDMALAAGWKDSLLVTGEPRLRFYAGMPLCTSDGFKIGTLAVCIEIDMKSP